jgi:hypothetical protein
MHVAALAHRHQLARVAEAAVQQRVGAERLGHLDVELERPVRLGSRCSGRMPSATGVPGRRAGRASAASGADAGAGRDRPLAARRHLGGEKIHRRRADEAATNTEDGRS